MNLRALHIATCALLLHAGCTLVDNPLYVGETESTTAVDGTTGSESTTAVDGTTEVDGTIGSGSGSESASGSESESGSGSTTDTGECGNGVVEDGEGCDGDELGGEDCVSQGFDAGMLACSDDCTAFDSSGCVMFACGNDSIEGMEVCDGAELGGEDCVTQGFDVGMLACQGDCLGLDTSGCANYGGDCCADNGTPGCDDAGCMAAICAVDASCCDTQWTPSCAAAAVTEPACQGVGGSCPVCGDDVAAGVEVCDGADLGGEDCVSQGFDFGTLDCQGDCLALDISMCSVYSGDCCMSHASPGCDDAGCTAAICAADPFCCDTEWDWICADAAVTEPSCQGVGGSCPNCGDDLAEGIEVCDGTDLGGEDCVTQGFGGGALVCQLDCLGLDTSGCVIYSGDCCAANGTPGCDDAGCTAAICAVDPLCCSNLWDGLCADAAIAEPACLGTGVLCPDPVCGDDLAEGIEVCDGTDLGGEDCVSQGFATGGVLACQGDCSGLDTSGCYSGDCCASNGTPGCDDAGCVATICAADPPCCDTDWDVDCANAAIAEPACNGVGGSCPSPCGNDVIEGMEVCDGTDLGIEDCVSQGFAMGGTLACQGDCSGFDTSMCNGDGDCCVPHAIPSCAESGCATVICHGALEYCCITEWDQACVDAALAQPSCNVGSCAL